MDTEVLIIGGGVIGLSLARELHRRGIRRIAVVERGRCGEESSWAAGGMLGPQAEADVRDLFFDFCCESRDLYPALAAELLDETGVDIELDRTGTLYLAFPGDGDHLLRRYRWQYDAGLPIDLLSQEEVQKLETFVSAPVQYGVLFPNDWQVENRKLLTALKIYAQRNGIAIHENTSIENLTIENGRITGAEGGSETFRADSTVLATGAWTSLIQLGHLPMPVKVEPVRGQMICLMPERPYVYHVIYSRRGYVVPRADGRVLAGSTTENAGFEKAVTDDATEDLLKMAAEISPFLRDVPVIDRWSGLRPATPDGMPILGPVEGIKDLFFATGHYRNGILLAPRTAGIMADVIVGGHRSEYLDMFGPDRFQTASAGVP